MPSPITIVFRGFSLLSDLVAASLAPERCSACDAPVALGHVLCTTCVVTVDREGCPRPRPDLAAFARYDGALVKAIHRFKYEDRPDLARPLGDLVAQAGASLIDGLTYEANEGAIDGVIPIPISNERLAERRYNQAALLANRASRSWGIPVLARALRRGRDTGHQARLGQQERQANLAGAFVVASPHAVKGMRVVLVDDVATTGATLAAAREALCEAGAVVVGSVVICATPRYTEE